jgi:hypothetical protein
VFKEEYERPNVLIAERLLERGHARQSNPVRDLPINLAVRIVFNAILCELRRVLAEAERNRARCSIGRAVARDATLAIELDTGEIVRHRGRNGIRLLWRLTSNRSVQRLIRGPIKPFSIVSLF